MTGAPLTYDELVTLARSIEDRTGIHVEPIVP